MITSICVETRRICTEFSRKSNHCQLHGEDCNTLHPKQKQLRMKSNQHEANKITPHCRWCISDKIGPLTMPLSCTHIELSSQQKLALLVSFVFAHHCVSCFVCPSFPPQLVTQVHDCGSQRSQISRRDMSVAPNVLFMIDVHICVYLKLECPTITNI